MKGTKIAAGIAAMMQGAFRPEIQNLRCHGFSRVRYRCNNGGKHMPHQGAKECQRRLAQGMHLINYGS